MADNTEDFTAYSGAKPTPSTNPLNPSYTSGDGRKIYLQFDDADSTGLSPSTGTQLRFSVTKLYGGLATTVTPSSTTINSAYPKTLILNLSSANKIVDAYYNTSGVAVSVMTVKVSYSTTAFGATVPYLGDNDNTRSLVDTFVGFGVSNRTIETNGPVLIGATSSYDGSTITTIFREATPPLFPYSGIAGFAVSQAGIGITITSAYVLDPTSATNGKKVVLNLSSPLAIDTGSNAVTLSYITPSANILTDSTLLRNQAVAFSGFAVSNITAETTKPYLISASTNSGSIGRTVFLVVSERTLPNSPSGFTVYKNNASVSFASTASTTSYLSNIVTQYNFGLIGTTFNNEDVITLNYVKPTSNFVYDLSANANTLDSLSSVLYVTNSLTDVTAPTVKQASCYVDKNGFDIYVVFDEYSSPPLLPASAISGFRVFVNGAASPTKTAVAINNTQNNNQVKISLYSKIHKNDIVTIGYRQDSPTTAYSLRDSSNNYVASFRPLTITNNTADNSSGFFDPLEWDANITLALSDGGNIGSGGLSSFGNGDDFFDSFQEVFSKEERYPSASVILDTHPPYGTVMFNRNQYSDDPGIKIHEFAAFGEEDTGSTIITDYNITHLLTGWEYMSNADQTISQVSFKLKKSGTIANSGDKIEFLLYSNEEPGTLVGKIGEIIYGDLTDSYKTFTFTPSSLSLTGSTNYWFVISLAALPLSNSGTASVYTAQVAQTDGVLAYYDEDLAKWIKTLGVSGYVSITSSNINGTPLSGRDIMLDILENPVRDAVTFGGSSDENAYETIGDTQFNYIVKKLNKITDVNGNKVYPSVVNIVVGASSSIPKNYSIEVKENPSDEWMPVFDTISDEDTYEFLDYKFDEPKQLCQIRLAYRGDYFSVDKTGTLTLAVRDDLSNVVSAQISHFSDFRDAVDFPNADVRGFVGARQGITEYSNYNISNSAGLWQGQTTYGTADGISSIQFGNKIIFASNNAVCFYYQNEIKTIYNTLNLGTTGHVSCFAIFKNKVYLGTTNGMVYSSYNGEFWTALNAKDPLDLAEYKYLKPINTMVAFGKYLFIGSSKGTTDYSTVYTFDGKSIIPNMDFDSSEITSSAAFANYVYFGMGNGYNSATSSIYRYNNSEWDKILASDSDSVDALVYCSATNSLVAGFSGGQIWSLPFDSNNDGSSWSLWYETYADNFYSITNDTGGNYLFAASSNGLYGYFKSLDQFKLITTFKSITPNLNYNVRTYDSFAQSFSADMIDMMSYNSIVYDAWTTALNQDYFATDPYTNFTLNGYIKAEYSGTYAFRLTTGLGVQVYINDDLVIDKFNAITSAQTYDASKTFTVTAGEYIKIQVFGANAATTIDYSFKLYWNYTNGEDGYEIIPASQFYRSNQVRAVWNSLLNFAGVGSDGNVYTFDPSFYETKVRRVYARFKDEAGNIHGIVLPGKTAPYPVIQDKITQDLKTVNGAKVSSGKIFQLKQSDALVLSTRAIYTPRLSNYSIYAPDRKVRVNGYWEVQPFYIPSLSQWGSLTALVLNKYGLNDLEGLDAGTEVRVYVKSGTSRDNVLSSNYGDPFILSYINNSLVPTTLESFSIPLQTFGGKWLQYKVELISATKNLSPELSAVTITYTAATGSFFYTKMFDAANYSSDIVAPKFRRGLLTSNQLENNGTITYGYTLDDSATSTYDFSKYVEITPNKTFELNTPSSKIRFAIMFTAVGATPSVVYDWGVQLDAGKADLKMMPGL